MTGMHKEPLPKLDSADIIVTAFAENPSGPGWSNQVVWIIVRGVDGKLRQECLQSYQLTPELWYLFGVSSAIQKSMVEAVDVARSRHWVEKVDLDKGRDSSGNPIPDGDNTSVLP